jgi:hypothetical protein
MRDARAGLTPSVKRNRDERFSVCRDAHEPLD